MRTASSAGLSALRMHRGRGRPRPRRQDRAARRPRGGGLSAQQEARRDRRGRAALRRVDRGADRRELRRRPDDGRKLGSAAGRAARASEAPAPEEDEEDEIEVTLGGGRGRARRSGERAPAAGRRPPGPPPPSPPPRRTRPQQMRDEAKRAPAGDVAPEAEAAGSARRPKPPVEQPSAEADPAAPGPAPWRRCGRRGRRPDKRVEPDSSPMVERPIAEEPPIAETEAARRGQSPSGGGRKKGAAVEAEGRAGTRRGSAGGEPPTRQRRQSKPPAKGLEGRRKRGQPKPPRRSPS